MIIAGIIRRKTVYVAELPTKMRMSREQRPDYWRTERLELVDIDWLEGMKDRAFEQIEESLKERMLDVFLPILLLHCSVSAM